MAPSERGEIDPPVDLDTLLHTLMAIVHGMALNDLPSLGVSFDKLEILVRAPRSRECCARPTNPAPPLNARSRKIDVMLKKIVPRVPDDGAARLGRPADRRGRARRRRRAAAPPRRRPPPAIRVVAAETRDIVEKLSVSGTIVAREEANAGTDLNGMIVTQLNADQGDVVKKGDVLAVLDRSTLDTQLAQNEASRVQAEANIAQTQSQIADAEVAVRQAGEALERARALQTKGFATKAELDNAVNASDSAKAKLEIGQARAVLRRRPRSPWSTRQKKSIDDPDREDRGEGAGRRPGAGAQRDARRHRLVVGRRAVPPGHRQRVRARRRRRRDRAAAARRRHAGRRSALPAGTAPVDGKIRLIAPEVEPDLAARHDPHLAAVGSGCRASAISPAPRSRRCAAARVAVPASAVVYADSDAFLQKVENGQRQDRAGQARRPRRRLCRSCFGHCRGRRSGVARRHLRRRRRHGDAGSRRADGSDPLMGWNFSAWAIRNPVPPILMFIVLMALGLMSFSKLPVTRFPNIDVPIVSVTVTDPGAAPSELETQVTKRVEDAVANISGVKNVTSTITEGSSQTIIEFRLEVDTQTARQRRQGRGRAHPRRPAAHHPRSRSSTASTSRARRS